MTDTEGWLVVRERCYICGKMVIGVLPQSAASKRLECSRCHGRSSRIVKVYPKGSDRQYVKHARGR